MSLMSRFFDETHEGQVRRLDDALNGPTSLARHRESTNTVNLLIDLERRTATFEDDIGIEDDEQSVALDEFADVVRTYLTQC